MNLKNKSIVLIDQLQNGDSTSLFPLHFDESEVVLLDPVSLFEQVDWLRYEEDESIANRMHSSFFDEVVVAKKRLVCFWPLHEQFGDEWFELTNLCSVNNYELDIYKSELLTNKSYGFSESILLAWKQVVCFLVDSLLTDIKLNEGLEEVATLRSNKDVIVLFNWKKDAGTKYTFAVAAQEARIASSPEKSLLGCETTPREFDSFQDMLDLIAEECDLSLYHANFVDSRLEKTYFNFFSRKFKAKNLIESWLITYSLN